MGGELTAVDAERERLRRTDACRPVTERMRARSAVRRRRNAAEHASKLRELEAEAETREQEMTVLMAHLQEARRPIQVIEGDIKRLKEELAAKTSAINDLTEEAEKLRAALERTRGALEEREFLIRRLERSESNNANVLGRIQTSMERLGSAAAPNAIQRRLSNGLRNWSESMAIEASAILWGAAPVLGGRRAANCISIPPR